MEFRRRVKKNKLAIDIRDAEFFIERSLNTIERIKSSTHGIDYIKNQITTLKSAIDEKTIILKYLKEELELINSGLLDDKIEEEYVKLAINNADLTKEQTKLKNIKQAKVKEDKQISSQYWKDLSSTIKSEKQKERDYKYGLKTFYKLVDTLPDYIKKNLYSMPNNKGYIFKGIYYFGYLPAENGPVVLFEKQRGTSILTIHEYTDKEYKRFEKDGKNRKILVYKTTKRIKEKKVSLLDYVKV